MPHPNTPRPWVVVLPIQHGDQAKTRLDAPARVSRTELARAIAKDTLAAVLACPQVQHVILVSSDPVLGAMGRGLGLHVQPDPGTGLPGAIQAGLDQAQTQHPGWPLAVLLADLPALRPADLSAALAACAEVPSAVVPDAQGAGSVLLTALGGRMPRARFGPDSAARHRAAGAAILALDLPRLRQDVDTAEDLARAQLLGLGPQTSRVLDLAAKVR